MEKEASIYGEMRSAMSSHWGNRPKKFIVGKIGGKKKSEKGKGNISDVKEKLNCFFV